MATWYRVKKDGEMTIEEFEVVEVVDNQVTYMPQGKREDGAKIITIDLTEGVRGNWYPTYDQAYIALVDACREHITSCQAQIDIYRDAMGKFAPGIPKPNSVKKILVDLNDLRNVLENFNRRSRCDSDYQAYDRLLLVIDEGKG